jgi:hypothetical protein
MKLLLDAIDVLGELLTPPTNGPKSIEEVAQFIRREVYASEVEGCNAYTLPPIHSTRFTERTRKERLIVVGGEPKKGE